jgi:hypothetical protein
MKNLLKLSLGFIFISLFFLVGCTEETNSNEIGCYEIYAPVCGVDGITYPNDCYAEQMNNVEIAYEGECGNNFKEEINNELSNIIYCTEEQKQAEFCTLEYMPVCGNDNNTYGNKCAACASGIDYYIDGEC